MYCSAVTSLRYYDLQTKPRRSWANNVTLAAILRHGPTLRTLRLHERETVPVDGQPIRYLLTSEDIKAIKSACTQLKDLTFDLHRKTSYLESEIETHAEIIEELSSWHSLAKVQIYYDLGIASLVEAARIEASIDSEEEDLSSEDGDAEVMLSSPPSNSARREELLYPKPSGNQAIEVYLPKLWSAIYGSRSFGARALDVKFGEWERKHNGSNAWAVTESMSRTHWVVTPRERDDQADQCAIKKYGTGIAGWEGGTTMF